MTVEDRWGSSVYLRLCYTVSKHKDMLVSARDDIAPVCCLTLGSPHQYNKDFLCAIRFHGITAGSEWGGGGRLVWMGFSQKAWILIRLTKLSLLLTLKLAVSASWMLKHAVAFLKGGLWFCLVCWRTISLREPYLSLNPNCPYGQKNVIPVRDMRVVCRNSQDQKTLSEPEEWKCLWTYFLRACSRWKDLRVSKCEVDEMQTYHMDFSFL